MSNERGYNALALKEGFDYFNAPRQEHEIDLVSLVRDAMIRAGIPEAQVIEFYDNAPLIMEVKDRQPSVQRWQLNRFWFLQLIFLPFDTSQVRFNLVPNGTEEQWFEIFKTKVLPFVKTNQLPLHLPN